MTEGYSAIPNWMFRDEKKPSAYAVMVYGALASHTGPGGVRPSQSTLAMEAQCSERKVRDALAELVEWGVVEVVRRRRGGGKSTTLTNGYVLHPHGRLAADEEAIELPARDAAGLKLPAHSDEATGTSEQITPLIEEKPVKKKRASRLSEEWGPSDHLIAWAQVQTPSVEVVVESENFRDYWLSRADKGAVKLDWDRTWQTWMRRAHQRNVERGWRSVSVPAPVVSVNPERDAWLSARGVTLEEYLERKDEPGWVESLRVRAS